MTDEFRKWRDRVLWGLVASLSGITIGWAAWITHANFQKPTKTEVLGIVQDSGPYVRDRALILESLENNKTASREFQTYLKANTEAIIELKTLIVVFKEQLERERAGYKNKN